MIQKGDLGNFGGEVLGCHVSSEFVSITLVPIGRFFLTSELPDPFQKACLWL